MDEYAGQFLIFFATLDPIGTLALFVGLTASFPAQERSKIALRAVAYSTAILVAAIVIGQLVLGSLGIRLAAFQLAGGIIFFLFGVQMVFGSGPLSRDANSEPDQDVAIFPLAVPSIASPGAILACVVLTDNREFSILEQAVSTLMLLAVLGITLVVLLLANRVYALIGNAGATLLVRVLGLVLAALAVEMVLGAGSELLADLGSA
ncbi:MAG: MarC family protein [Myxococcota bacterium]|nr:MarC family protein [Myxococcota bacterium]